jgi:AraC family chitin signaling transcriptional activator
MNTKLNHIEDWLPIARQAGWSVTKMAKLCGVSVGTLRRHFLKHVGKTTRDWLTEQQQRLAIELLRDGSSIKETAGCLGYEDPTNFSRRFKQHWGVCPSLLPPANQSDPK